jgi:drug/metabolite transporter (DMT)-like permease
MVLIGIGVSDFCLKIFQQWRPAAEKAYFIFVIFTCAFFYTLLIILKRKIVLNRFVMIRGFVLGIPNVLSTVFLLLALAQMPAIFVFPAVNIGIILLTSVGAVIFWKEKLNKFGVLALISGIFSILFLQI